MDLVQGTLTVREYAIRFDWLSRFAYHLIDTLEKKNQKYHRD